MSRTPPDASIPELENPIIRRAYVMLDQPPLETLVQSLLNDRYLQSKSDEDLIRIIEEADQHWREQYKDCVRKPGVIERYAPLMSACCKQRYDSLRKLREVAPEDQKALLTARMGRLLTVQGHCMLAGAESLLLNEHFQQAYQEFGKAEWVARALPDEGSLRLYEIMWARYGQWVTAKVAGQQQETDSAHAGVGELLQAVGPPATECLQRVEQLFSRHQWALQERERLRRELREGHPPPEAPKDESDEGILIDLITSLASAVRSGEMTMEAARAHIREVFPQLQLPPGVVRTAALLFDAQAARDLEHTIRLLELTSELALQFPNQPEMQSTCLGALGYELNRLAMTKESGYERAVSTLEQAYALISSNPEFDLQAANISLGLAVSYKGLRNQGEQLKWSELAVGGMERSMARSPSAPLAPGPAQAMGTAYGLRGEAREFMGDTKSALEDHFNALKYFRIAGSGLDIRKALHHISDLCASTNQLDEAAIACDELLKIAQDVGDVDDVAPTTLSLAMALVRVSRYAPAVVFLDRADRLVLKALEKTPEDAKLLGYHFQFCIWAARFYGVLLREAPLKDEEQRQMAQQSYETIEHARLVALDLGRNDMLAAAWIEHILLQETLGNLERARTLCLTVDSIPACPPQLRAFRYLVEGRIAATQKQFRDALALLDLGLKTFAEDEWDDIRIRFLKTRAAVKEELGDRNGAITDYEDAVKRTAGFRDSTAEESRVAIFGMAEDALDRLFLLNAETSPFQDTKQALHWAEYSKSRALAELLGQSAFTLPAPSPEVAALCNEEQQLLAAVHSMRATSLAEAVQVTLDQSHTMQLGKARLNEIWNEMSARYPEYVELRRGAVPSWEEIVEMTAE
jgi:tetratricopeptide (TPR) repeat protein